MNKKGPLRLVVPVGLLDRTSRTADGTSGASRRVGAERVRGQISLFQHFDGLQIGKLSVAGIFQDQRLGTVADHNPLAMTYQQFSHRLTSKQYSIIRHAKSWHFALSQTFRRSKRRVSSCRRAAAGQ